MNHLDFHKIIIEKKASGTYYFYGYEGLLIDNAINRILKTYVNEMTEYLNYFVLDGKLSTTQDVTNAVETVPFMSDYKLIVVTDTGMFFQNNDLSDSFIDGLLSVPDNAILIFNDMDNGIKKTTKFYKSLNKANRAVEFTKLSPRDLNVFVNREFSSKKKKISPSDLSYFVNNTGYNSRNLEVNLYQVVNEVSKISAVAKGEIITRNDIDAMLIEELDTNIFDFLDGLMRKNLQTSISNFNSLYQLNEPMQRILFMIVRQFRLLLGYKTYITKGYSDVEIMKKIGIKQYEFKKIVNSQRNFTDCEIIDIMGYLNNAEKKMKSTSIDERLVLEELIVKICNKK